MTIVHATLPESATGKYLRDDGTWQTVSGGPGATDHGDLSGLADDDHTQYHNDTRGDARYSQLGHGHAISDVTGLQTALDGKQAAGSYAAASHTHVINDVTGLQTALDGKQTAGSYADATHTHAASDIASGTVATARLGSGSASATTFLRGDQTWATPTASVSLTSTSAALGGDVQLVTSSTWYDGPSVSLAAGTWLVSAHVTVARTTTTALTYFSRISDGTTHYASTQAYQASVANHSDSLSLTAVITLVSTTTIKVQTTTNAGATTALMKAATTANGSGNNATQITAIKIA